jgi:putative protease
MFELSTNISNLHQLRRADYSAYDAIYLGDFSCPQYPNNFSSHPDKLREGVDMVKAEGKKCYLRLYAVPSNHDLPWVREMIEEAMTLPLDALEVHNMGVLRVLKEMDCPLPVHLGVFANLYTHESAKVLKGYGVRRGYPNPELSLKEVVYIQENADVEVLVPIHGKIPLVISETCFIVEHSDRDADDCAFLCSQDYWLHRADWTLKDIGRMTLSGKDLCMIEHVGELVDMGLEKFFVQSMGESLDYIGTVGRIYREAFMRALSGEDLRNAPLWVDELRLLAKMGLCNGYYFEGAGQKYIGRTPAWSSS